MKKQMKTKILVYVFGVLLITSNKKVLASEMQNVDNSNGIKYEFSKCEKSVLERIESSDGEQAAKILNGFEDNVSFNRGVEWVLEQYYDDDGSVKQGI